MLWCSCKDKGTFQAWQNDEEERVTDCAAAGFRDLFLGLEPPTRSVGLSPVSISTNIAPDAAHRLHHFAGLFKSENSSGGLGTVLNFYNSLKDFPNRR